MVIARDSNSYVDECTNESPDESRNARRCTSEELEGERDRVNVRAVVCNDGKCEDNQAETAEGTKRSEDCC